MLNKIQKTIFIFFLVIFPAFSLNYFANPFDLPKIFLLTFFLAILIFTLGIEVATKGKMTLKLSNLDVPLLLFAVSYVISGIAKTPNKMEAFYFPGTALVVILGFLIYRLGKKVFDNKKEEILTPLFFSGLLVSLISILSLLRIFALIPSLPTFLKEPYFSSTGGKLPETILLISLLPIGILELIKNKDIVKKILFGLSALIIIIATTIDISFILPNKSTAPVLASFRESWIIAVSTLKESPAFGIGPSNYIEAFARYVPVSHNASPFWSFKFSSGSSFILTLATETGLVGLTAFVVLIFFLGRIFLSNYKDLSNLPLLILTVSFFILPANIVLITVFFLLLVNVSKDKLVDLKLPKLLSAALFFVTGITFFFATKVLSSEVSYKKAISSIDKNDGRSAYNALREAITLNPYVDRYHTAYSQVNLSLAQNLSQKPDVTSEEKETTAQLVQQSIREAKATVTLNPKRSFSWELLAKTYRVIIPFAQGADNFSIQSFNQAIALDPTNVNLRIDLGGVYYALGRYEEAIASFNQAVAMKPDLANAHYNLAITYREKGDKQKAIDELNTVLSLVEKGSSDHEAAQKELENIKKGIKPEGKEETTPAAALPEFELPEDAEPPIQ